MADARVKTAPYTPTHPATEQTERPSAPPSPGYYELRYTYDPDTTLGEADVVCTHEQLHDIAIAFAGCAAPFKQILWVEDGEPDWLDEQEEAYVAAVCAEHGFDVEERDYGEGTA